MVEFKPIPVPAISIYSAKIEGRKDIIKCGVYITTEIKIKEFDSFVEEIKSVAVKYMVER